jgi:hypothetical protein
MQKYGIIFGKYFGKNNGDFAAYKRLKETLKYKKILSIIFIL